MALLQLKQVSSSSFNSLFGERKCKIRWTGKCLPLTLVQLIILWFLQLTVLQLYNYWVFHFINFSIYWLLFFFCKWDFSPVKILLVARNTLTGWLVNCPSLSEIRRFPTKTTMVPCKLGWLVTLLCPDHARKRSLLRQNTSIEFRKA